MGFLTYFWDGLLAIPLGWLESYFHFDVTGWKGTVWRGVFVVILLFALYEIVLRVKKFRRQQKNKRLMDEIIVEPGVVKDNKFVEQLEAVHAPEQAIAALKRRKEWTKLGELCVSLNRHKDAAKAFGRAKDLKRSAMEWAKAGKTLRAARLLKRAGDNETAARFYMEKNKFLAAAKIYEKTGDRPNAGFAYAKAKKYPPAIEHFLEYFKSSKDEAPKQVEAAAKCYEMMQPQELRDKITEAQRKQLMFAIAQRFDAGKRFELAAKLYGEVGDLARAGQSFLHAGKLELAAQCLNKAGKTKEAAEIAGRHYEQRGLWREAATSYRAGEQFRKAGDCFTKAMDPTQAAECYEKAGEYFGAGFAYVHADKWEGAIPMLQKVPEDSPHFAESRALLGRCFYQLQDYSHCAATLENHLLGERVASANIDYFWMLALAYEQLGELEKSKDVLLKIRSVNVGFRDVSQRLSNIQSRISIVSDRSPSSIAAAMATPRPPSSDATAVMTMVENNVGQRYKLEKELGRGGMGVVYMATDTQLDRPVALKFIGSLVDGNEEFRQRFTREAQTAAKVNHPNIVSIYEISMQEGKAFIAMEFIEGVNLQRYLSRKGKLEAREATNIIAQSLSALAAIHDVGIVHRDIKPDNIVLAKGGLVKLMDFGLAKTENKRLTGANVIMGTPCYMSPEQTRGEDVDNRTDIYALGLVFHELLTGKTVFGDGDILKRQQIEVPPPPSAVEPTVPKVLDEIIMKAVAKDPKERYQTAKELLDALRQATSK